MPNNMDAKPSVLSQENDGGLHAHPAANPTNQLSHAHPLPSARVPYAPGNQTAYMAPTPTPAEPAPLMPLQPRDPSGSDVNIFHGPHSVRPLAPYKRPAPIQELGRHNDGSILNQEEVSKAYNQHLINSRNAPPSLSYHSNPAAFGARPAQPDSVPDPRHARFTCLRCAQIGHILRNCPNPPTPKEVRERTTRMLNLPVICLNCAQQGHIARNCMNPKAPKEIRDRLLLTLPVPMSATQKERLAPARTTLSRPKQAAPAPSTSLRHPEGSVPEDKSFMLNRFLAEQVTHVPAQHFDPEVPLHNTMGFGQDDSRQQSLYQSFPPFFEPGEHGNPLPQVNQPSVEGNTTRNDIDDKQDFAIPSGGMRLATGVQNTDGVKPRRKRKPRWHKKSKGLNKETISDDKGPERMDEDVPKTAARYRAPGMPESGWKFESDGED